MDEKTFNQLMDIKARVDDVADGLATVSANLRSATELVDTYSRMFASIRDVMVINIREASKWSMAGDTGRGSGKGKGTGSKKGAGFEGKGSRRDHHDWY